MVLKNQPQRRLGPYGGITGRRRGRFKTNDAWARTEALRADGEGGITGGRRGRFKTNAAWARTGALRADGEGGSKPTPLGPVRRHYGRTEREIQNQRHLGPYGGITGRRRRRIKGTLLSSSRIASLFVSPYRFPLSSHRTVFPSRLPVNFLYGAKWLWFYGFKEPTPTTLGPVWGHYGQTERKIQNQRRLGPYGGITGRRRGGHYGRTEREVQNQRRLGPYGGITGRRRRRSKGTLLSSLRTVFLFCLTALSPRNVFPFCLPVIYTPSSPRNVPVRGKVALVLGF